MDPSSIISTIDDEPLPILLITSHVPRIPKCSYCKILKFADLYLCSNCNNVRYCGNRCQLLHWKEHKKDCDKK